MYQLLLEIEDHEKKALALPEQDRYVCLYVHELLQSAHSLLIVCYSLAILAWNKIHCLCWLYGML